MVHFAFAGFLIVFLILAAPVPAQENDVPDETVVAEVEELFPLHPELKDAFEFWKLIFTQFGYHDLVFFDPREPLKIYKVVRVEEGKSSQAVIEAERKSILEEHGLSEEEGRIRVQRGVRERFAMGLSRSGKYLEQMRGILQEEGVPVELAYLPLVESAFDVQARSRVGAVGLWQFMPRTGKRFLRVGRTIDERKDPIQSTRAAARYLKENYRRLGNWPLAITAYNHGAEGILRGVREVGSSELAEIVKSYQGPAFGFASKNFYTEFLAAVEVARRSEEFFPNIQYHPRLTFEELELERPLSIAALLKRTNVSRSEFLEWNPALGRRLEQIPGWYRVKVPAEKSGFFQAALGLRGNPATVVSAQAEGADGSWIPHRVVRGETLSHLAKQYGIPVQVIQRANGIPAPHLITVGQHLKIPQRLSSEAPGPLPSIDSVAVQDGKGLEPERHSP